MSRKLRASKALLEAVLDAIPPSCRNRQPPLLLVMLYRDVHDTISADVIMPSGPKLVDPASLPVVLRILADAMERKVGA